MQLQVIAHARNGFSQKFGIPRQSREDSCIETHIIFTPAYRVREALRGIEDYSHLWLLWGFHEAIRREGEESWSPTVRPPRLGGNKRMGVFATRSPFRPNPIGLTSVKLLRVEETADNGLVLIVSGADLLDGTPIYDIKPYIPMADCIENAKGGYTEETAGHRLKVIFPEELKSLLPEEKQQAAIQCLADDPRPSYQEDSRAYTMAFAGFDLTFEVLGDTLFVRAVKIL